MRILRTSICVELVTNEVLRRLQLKISIQNLRYIDVPLLGLPGVLLTLLLLHRASGPDFRQLPVVGRSTCLRLAANALSIVLYDRVVVVLEVGRAVKIHIR